MSPKLFRNLPAPRASDLLSVQARRDILDRNARVAVHATEGNKVGGIFTDGRCKKKSDVGWDYCSHNGGFGY